MLLNDFKIRELHLYIFFHCTYSKVVEKIKAF